MELLKVCFVLIFLVLNNFFLDFIKYFNYEFFCWIFLSWLMNITFVVEQQKVDKEIFFLCQDMLFEGCDKEFVDVHSYDVASL